MPSFGKRSRQRLIRLDSELVGILEEAILHIDFTILTTKRSKEAQDEAHAMGRSKVRWPDSKHNCAIENLSTPRAQWLDDPIGYSRAVDVAPWLPGYPHIRWGDADHFCYLQGIIKGIAVSRGIDIRFGGDWDRDGLLNRRDPDNSFNDLPHVELL